MRTQNPLKFAAPAMMGIAMCLMVSAAIAQPPGPPGEGRGRGPGGPGGRGGPGGGIGELLRVPEVRGELEILDDQEQQLRELEQEIRDRIRSQFEEMRGMPRDREAWGEMRARMEEIRGEAEERVSQVLSESQMQRLRQIGMQQRMQRGGARALMSPEVGEALGITDEQREVLREKGAELRKELDQKIRALRAESQEELMEVLTTEQRAKLQEMMGDKFDLPEDVRRDRRGRGGDRGQRGERGPRGRRGDGPPPPPPGPELD